MSGLTGLAPAAELAESKPHGARIKYMGGCRCLPCRAANSRYEVERSAARRRGEWNGMVSAENCRKHLKKLLESNIGLRTVSDISGIGRSTLLKIRSGARKNIRKLNEQKILSVAAEPLSDKVLLPARPTWQKINRLLGDGFTKAALARRLGYKTPALQINKKKVTAAVALKVEIFYDRIYAGE